jgi:hypothetical protein
VISQIERLGLLVSVAFVGDRLMETVQAVDAEAEADADAGRNNSYLLFHYTPSAVTSSFNLTSVKFEPCDERWDESEEEEGFAGDGPDCLYNYNRFAKVSSFVSLVAVVDMHCATTCKVLLEQVRQRHKLGAADSSFRPSWGHSLAVSPTRNTEKDRPI